MVRLFDVLQSSTGGLVLGAREFASPALSVFVVYDTPTEGQILETTTGNISLPDYLSWKGFTYTIPNPDNISSVRSAYRFQTSDGIQTTTGYYLSPFGGLSDANGAINVNVLPINNSCLFTNSEIFGISGYDQLYSENFSLMTDFEFKILKQLIMKLDHVRRRYPSRFEKKFSIEELLVYIEAALIDINLTSPVTKFWWMYLPERTGQYQYNPMVQPNCGVPELLYNLIVTGSLIHALIGKGILEVDLNFSYSDQGIQLTYDNASHYASWHDRLLAGYAKDKMVMKQHFRPKGRAVGTIPEFGLGWFGMLNSMLDNRYNQVFYPFWLSGNSGRAQL